MTSFHRGGENVTGGGEGCQIPPFLRDIIYGRSRVFEN